MNEFIGRQLGQIPYQRNRPLEFSATGVPRQELLTKISDTQKVVEKALNNYKSNSFSRGDSFGKDKYPENVLGYDMSVHYFLVHLTAHLNYHLGQIDYHRRFLTGEKSISFVSL